MIKMNSKNYTLKDYLKMLGDERLIISADLPKTTLETEVTSVEYNSSKVEMGGIFFAKGRNFKKEYAQDSIKRGALVIIAEENFDVPNSHRIIVSDVEKAMALCGNMFYKRPWEHLDMIGITGTKGKSTVTYFVKQILEEWHNGSKQGHLSGISNYYGIEEVKSNLTTPISLDLFNYLDIAARSGLKQLVMEVSSQGIKYNRVAGVIYNIGCFLNLGLDHISPVEHPDVEDYLESKLKLMENSKCSIVNADSKEASRAIKAAESSGVNKKIITFSLKNKEAGIYGYDIRPTKDGYVFFVNTVGRRKLRFEIGLKGEFNISNALCAIAISEELGIHPKYIAAGLKKTRVPGRMEIKRNLTNDKIVIVDFAHNEMSFDALFDFVKKEYPNRELSVVFGCVGDKAEVRRFLVGKVVGRAADKCYITEHKSGREVPEKIFEEVAEGVKSVGGTYKIIFNNNEAIDTAYMSMDEGGVLLVACNILWDENIASKELLEFK